MIIFDLDGTLAKIEHRRYLIAPKLHPDFKITKCSHPGKLRKKDWVHKRTGKTFKPNWDAFFEACDKDEPNWPVIKIFRLFLHNGSDSIEIWSGRSEKVRDKTIRWLYEHIGRFSDQDIYHDMLHMRPIGDYTPDEQLKEQWLDIALSQGKKVEMVFDDRTKVVQMWRRRGITCFQIAEGNF